MNISTYLRTWFCGQLVGQDAYGNRYYQDKKIGRRGYKRRWVIYKGLPEASKVPAEWHGWLHYTCDLPNPAPKWSWVLPHQPNATGTKRAYKPKFTGALQDYQPWRPDNA